MGANGAGNVVGSGPPCVNICDAGSSAGADAGASVAPTTGGNTEMTGSVCRTGRAVEANTGARGHVSTSGASTVSLVGAAGAASSGCTRRRLRPPVRLTFAVDTFASDGAKAENVCGGNAWSGFSCVGAQLFDDTAGASLLRILAWRVVRGKGPTRKLSKNAARSGSDKASCETSAQRVSSVRTSTQRKTNRRPRQLFLRLLGNLGRSDPLQGQQLRAIPPSRRTLSLGVLAFREGPQTFSASAL